jgi:predicted SnoaL-like aldol condensation-catalyzing enzyme
VSTEHNKAIVRRWLLEGFNNHDLTAVEECLTDDYVNHGTTSARGYEAGRQVLTQARAFGPDAKIAITYMVAEGDMVMVLFTVRGTYAPPSGGAAQGRQVNLTMVDIFRFRDGKICEGWVIRDRMEMQEQLGMLPGRDAPR